MYEDPYLVVGHCLLALIGAGLGGVLGPLACNLSNQPPGHVSVN